MAKVSKAQARKRIGEARRKLQNVIFNCDHLTPAQYRKLQKIYEELLQMTGKMM